MDDTSGHLKIHVLPWTSNCPNMIHEFKLYVSLIHYFKKKLFKIQHPVNCGAQWELPFPAYWRHPVWWRTDRSLIGDSYGERQIYGNLQFNESGLYINRVSFIHSKKGCLLMYRFFGFTWRNADSIARVR
jgi:hypothetical protein